MAMMQRYRDFNSYLRGIFGCRVQKISVDAGMTCPNRDGTLSRGGCIYCNVKGSGTGAFDRGLSITAQLEAGKKHMGRRYKAQKFMAYFQSFSNTHAPVETLQQRYGEALAVADIVGLSIGTRPDCVNDSVLDLLESYTRKYLIWIEYGLQSAHDRSLLHINRGHDFDCFRQAVAQTIGHGIKICTHVILGLPGETRHDMLKTADIIAQMPIDGIKLHLLYVIKGTPLEQMYQQGQYHCLSQAEYTDLVCDFLERLPSDLIIQRLTSDPHREELVAPKWSLNKRETLKRIHNTLECRNTRQGCRFVPGLPS